MPTYFIQAGEKGPIKIGFALSPVDRLAYLQTAHYRTLRLLGTSEVAEAELHARFAHFRVRGEWFQPRPEVLAAIEAPHATPPAKPRTDVQEVIRRLGGPSRLAQQLRLLAGDEAPSQSGISMWNGRQVPWRWRAIVDDLLAKRDPGQQSGEAA